MKKRLMGSVLAGSMVAGSIAMYAPAAFAASNSLAVVIDGKKYELNQTLHNDRTYVQLRSLQDAFHADVDYDGATQVVTVTRGDKVVTIDLTTNKVKLNGVEVKDMPTPYLDKKANRTMVPLRKLAELFGQNVAWDTKSNTVSISQTQQALDQEKQIQSILDAANKAAALKNAMHMGMTMNMKMTGLDANSGTKQDPTVPSSMNMEGKFDGDAIQKPFAMHLNGQVTAVAGPMSQTMNMEMYMQNGTMYLNDPTTHQWGKMQFMTNDEWQQLMNTMQTGSTAQDQQQTELFLPFMKLSTDSQNNYVVTTYLNKTLLQTIQTSAGTLPSEPTVVGGNSATSLPTDQMPNLKNMTVTVTIDKTTNLDKEIKLDMQMTGPSGEPMNMMMDMDILVDYDHVNAVVIPDSVINNAQDLAAQ